MVNARPFRQSVVTVTTISFVLAVIPYAVRDSSLTISLSYTFNLAFQHYLSTSDLIDPAATFTRLYMSKIQRFQTRLKNIKLFIPVQFNTTSPLPAWQQIGDLLAAGLHNNELAITLPVDQFSGGRSYESEGWIFLKPSNLIQNARILKPLDQPGRNITLEVLRLLTKTIHNALSDELVIHICMSYLFLLICTNSILICL
jgi:hypothetical protein